MKNIIKTLAGELKAMVRPEYTNWRPLDYSNWHRTLPDHCYMMDFDSIEVRGEGPNMKIVAFIETKGMNGKLGDWHKKVLLKAARNSNAEAYCVYHNMLNNPDQESWLFIVIDLFVNEEKRMNVLEYTSFIENLGKYPNSRIDYSKLFTNYKN